jgi:anti-sigma B factor antagonist
MSLTVTTQMKQDGVYTVTPTGSVDTETYQELERAVDEAIKPSPRVIILDMKGVSYVSSVGLGVIFKAKKSMEEAKGVLILTNLQPNVKRVFETIKAIPSLIFENIQEADEHLDAILRDIQQKKSDTA